MLIKIKQDGTFESLSAVDHAARAALLTTRIKEDKAKLAERKKILPKVRTAMALRNTIATTREQHIKDKTREKLNKLYTTYGIGPRLIARTVGENIDKLEESIKKNTELLANTKAKMKSPVTKKPTAKTAPAVKTVKARGSKITVDINKTAGNKIIRNNAKISKLSNEKAKPAAALHKKDNVKSPAITNVLSKIKAIKEDIAKTKVVSKRQHMEKELAALRSQLRVLRKGQSTKNQAAVTKAKPSGNMGGAKKVTTKQKGMGDAKATPLDIKDQRAKVSDLRIKVAKEKDPVKKAALEKRYASAVSKMKKMKLVK